MSQRPACTAHEPRSGGLGVVAIAGALVAVVHIALLFGRSYSRQPRPRGSTSRRRLDVRCKGRLKRLTVAGRKRQHLGSDVSGFGALLPWLLEGLR